MTASRLPLRLALAAAAASGLAGPAAAQWFERPVPFGYNAPMPPYGYGYGGPRYARPLRPDEILDRLEDQGFEDMGRPRFAGETYEVEATSPIGTRVRLIVDAYRGAVLQRAALGRGRGGEEWEDGPRVPRGVLQGRVGPPSPYDEAPEAPPSMRRRPAAPPREAARAQPDAPIPLAPPSGGALPPPTDPRVAPGLTEPARLRSRSLGATPLAHPKPPRPRPGGLYGTNPGQPSGGTSKAAPRPPKAAADTQKAVPPSTAQAAPAPGERKPVRVIEGVTPMNGGGSAPPAPGGDGSAKPAQ